MHPAFILILLLCFPAVEVYLLLRFLESAPLPTVLWFGLASFVGWRLLRRAKAGFAALMAEMRGRGAPLPAFFAFGKMWLAGALLLFPGFISDALALLVALLPGRLFGAARRKRVIEGTYEPLD